MVPAVSDSQVIVMGGGIAGCLTACLLADADVRVLLIEQDARLMNGASRWNDGKVHLGYTFTGTSSLATASLLLQGAAAFFPTLERVTGGRLPPDALGRPVVYLVDRGSMVGAETLWGRARATEDLARRALDGLPGLDAYPGLRQRHLERLDADQAEVLAGQTGVVAAWRTPEVHVAARVVADTIVAAVEARPVDVLHGRVMAVEACGDDWVVRTDGGEELRAPAVVNATWEGRSVLDRQVEPSPGPVSIRYKYALFGQGSGPSTASSRRPASSAGTATSWPTPTVMPISAGTPRASPPARMTGWRRPCRRSTGTVSSSGSSRGWASGRRCSRTPARTGRSRVATWSRTGTATSTATTVRSTSVTGRA